MPPWTTHQARRAPFIPAMRELVRCYQAFERVDAALHRERGLTPSQADVVFTLGNTEGMTCKELGERTLITKGTLTGVLDRLESKGLIRRVQSTTDRRSFVISLTRDGIDVFEESFPAHIRALQERFDALEDGDLETLQSRLARLRSVFEE